MTDPVTNVEIEDVLSSIRRLVSDDARVLKPAQPPVNQSDKLVLTPSLRVSSDEPAAPVSETEARAESTSEPAAPMLLTDMAPLVEEAAPEPDLTLEEAETDSDAADSVAFPHPSENEQDTETNLAEAEPEQAGTASEDEHEEVSEDADKEPQRDLSALVVDGQTQDDPEDENKPAELGEAALLMQIVEQEVEKVLGDDTAGETAEDEAQEIALDVSGQDEVNETLVNLLETSEDPGEEPDPETSVTPAAESLEDKIAALEELVGRGHAEDWEPEAPQEEAPVFQRSSEVLEWQDHLQDGNDAFTADGIQSEVESLEEAAEKHEAAQPSASAIDEEMLRKMVADLIRQELQGALGERITRNVRKLVRREIHRVLMSQDFE